jgi:GTPase Era involved in 16S rRNA processing
MTIVVLDHGLPEITIPEPILACLGEENTFLVLNKVDGSSKGGHQKFIDSMKQRGIDTKKIFQISALTGAGVDALVSSLTCNIQSRYQLMDFSV